MRVVLGILLIVAAVAFLVFSIIPAITEDNQFALDIFEPIYCASGEQLSSERVVGPSSDGGINMTAYYTCMRVNETSYDATGRMVLITGAGFTVPLLLGILLIITGARRQSDQDRIYYGTGGQTTRQPRRRTSVVTVNTGGVPSSEFSFDPSASAPAVAPDDIFNMPLDAPAASSEPGLQEKLRQLEAAYDQHLINHEEYERKRAEILREF
ncbi:MAG: SHOCT domain-containing protein [Chloroflexota bacterium]